MKPLICLRGVGRDYPSGEDFVSVLRGVDLDIYPGEYVAIIGPSGSGKSTLMNIIGCLDRPTSGAYQIAGRDTAQLDPDELAELRREHFGFIFQRYHLLSEFNALDNVEMPAVYAGVAAVERTRRASALLSRLGLAERLRHRPGQLSGGQQQRVSIARALMNRGEIVLADEPTGALDRRSGEEVLAILAELNAEGQTIVMVTHDASVAAHAGRIIEISDGEIVSDKATRSPRADQPSSPAPARANSLRARADRFGEALRMALLAMTAHRLRTLLTMLGVIIGITSVVAMVALGEGSRRKVLSQISSLGTNTLEIFPGKDFGDTRSAKVTTLVVADSDILARQPYSAGATPTVSTSKTIRYGGIEASVLINGVGRDYFAIRGSKLIAGRLFDAESERLYALDAVLDENALSAVFPGEQAEAVLGRVVFAGSVPCTIVGVIAKQQGGFGGSGNAQAYLPYSSVQARFLGNTVLRSILLRIADNADTEIARQATNSLLLSRHGVQDFFILNTDDIRQTITAATTTLAALIAAIALISLIVGGIGVMNIMLVSVSERVKEIGVRMAVGARRSDIMQQFLTEAVLVCLIGGVLGIALAFGIGALISAFGPGIQMVYSSSSILAALGCSSLIGIGFGWLPARSAARLDPVEALARE
jgi:macrolide transport system ATP-binding/permease protein